MAGDRQHTAALMPLLRPGPHGLAAALSAALRQQLREEFAREPGADATAARGAAVAIDQLTLVDDQQIEEDIEVARVIQLVDAVAEAELRDLRALGATLRASEAVPEVVPLGMDRSPYPDRIVPRRGFEKELAKRTLTNLYNQRPAWLAQAHEALDAAVAAAYGWADYTPALPDDQILRRLLALNLARSAKPPSG